ncbi:MAG: hypothetical protein KC656_21925, partial [Myxococcales bacterium]|nr:hypothetical protein [Myxococcales bacterium]
MAGRRLVPLLLGACAAPSLPEGVDLEVVEGCVVLPGDVQAAEVVNALEGVPVVDGCFRLHVRTEGPMLALAVDADQIPVRMGWISPDRPDLDARLTAEALGWLAVGGPGAGLEASPTLHALLAADDRLDPVAEALDLALVEGGSAAYSARLPGVASALSVAAWAMHTEKPSEDPEAQRNAVLVDPGGPQSGLTVTQDAGVNQVSVVNTFRRGGAIFIDRVSTFDERGEETAAPLAVADVELRSVQALTGGLDAVAQLMAAAVQPGGVQGSEDVAYVPRTHGPFQLDPVPDARKTRYRVAVVGPGFSAGALPDLTPAQQTRQLDASVAFIAREYVLPLILQVVVPSASLNDRTDTALAEAITQDLVRLIGSQLPTVGPQVAGGDA